jgi:hypothetical protein
MKCQSIIKSDKHKIKELEDEVYQLKKNLKTTRLDEAELENRQLLFEGR